MKTLMLDDTKIMLPCSWNELTCRQLRFLAKLCIKGAKSGEIKLKMLLFCSKLRVRKPFMNDDYTTSYIIQKGRKRFNIDQFVFAEITTVFDFLFNQVDELSENQTIYIEPDGLTNNPIPRIRVWKRWLFGPGDVLINLNMSEFSLIEVYRSEYVINGSQSALNKMLSILYRPKGNIDGDNRKPLTSKVANNGYWRVNRIKPADKLIIYWYYTGVLLYLRQKFIRTFSDDSNGGKHNIYDDMSRMIDSLAAGDMTKKNQVREGLLWDALYSIEGAMEKAENLEQ